MTFSDIVVVSLIVAAVAVAVAGPKRAYEAVRRALLWAWSKARGR